MFNEIKEALQSIDTVKTLSTTDIYYAYKWVDENRISVSDEVFSYLVTESEI